MNNDYLIKLTISLLTNNMSMTDEMFDKFENGYFRNYTLKPNRSLVPRPPHFGAIKYYENGIWLKRKYRYKYWELWFIQSGELLVKFDLNENTNCKKFERKREKFFKDKILYLQNYRKKELV